MMYIIIITIISLFYNSIILATEFDQENTLQDGKNSFVIAANNIDYNNIAARELYANSNSDEEMLIALEQQSAKEILLEILTGELNKRDFNRINGNYIGLKILIFILAISACESGDLLITNKKQITPEAIMATQMGVSVNTASMYLVLDNLMLAIQLGIVNILKTALQHKLKLLFTISKFGTAITLGYLASVVETESSGDGYQWLLGHATSNATILDIAYYYGYYAHLFFALNLYGVFFYQLINSVLAKTGIGYLLKMAPAPTENFNMLAMNKHVNNMLAMVNQQNIYTSIDNISYYIKSHNLNSSFYIADMKNILTNTSVDFSKKYNLFTNLTKIAFICSTTFFCGMAFKQIFAARILLKDFVDEVGNHTHGRIFFYLKNGTEISCADTTDCIHNLDFESIAVDKQRLHKIIDSNYQAVLSFILGGVSISSEAAAIILVAIDSIIKLTKNNLYKQVLKVAYLKNNNLWPYLFCMTVIPPFYFDLKNIIDTYDIADNYNRLLNSIGENQLLTAKQAIIINIASIAIAFGSYATFVANIPRAINYCITKIKSYISK